MKLTKQIRDLPCKMTAAEVALKSAQMAAKLEEMGTLEAKKKSVTTQLAEEIKEVREQLNYVGREVRTGLEYRPVTCIEEADFATSKVDLVRTDTGEVVSTRVMHPDERQQVLDLRERELEAMREQEH